MRLRLNIIFAAALTLVVSAHAAAPTLGYNHDVRPILSDNCFQCHGPDKANRKAKMRLDVREDALAKEAFVPGKPEESEIIKRLFTTNEDDVMPPADSHKKLSAAQKEILKRWVAEGAVYEPHWSFITPQRPAVPLPANRKVKFLNPIDAFILAQLAAKKIQPSPEANRATLLRRVSLDLTGLPPTPEEVAAFLKDKSANAYEKQVDRLLASAHFGERMAVPWLDIVRFADTVGYHGDQNVNVFPYRDYVINAFNANKPFDQFTIEQLAGDLLPNNTVEQRVATGFNRLNMMTREGGAQPKEYLAKYGADRARTVGMAWMGLTVGCAECHDHKFDPFTAKDFYSLKAYFADVRQWGVYNDYKYTPNPDLKGWDNDHPFPPEEVVESPFLQRRIEKLNGQILALAKKAEAGTDGKLRDAWQKAAKSVLKTNPDGWLMPAAFPLVTNVAAVTNRMKLTNVVAATDAKAATTNVTTQVTVKTNRTVLTNFIAQADGALLFGSKGDGHPIPLRLEAGSLAALRLELLPHASHSNTIFRGKATSTTIQLSATLRRAGAKKETKLSFYHADADQKQPRYANGFEILGIKDSWKIGRDHAKEKLTGIWLLDPPVTIADGDVLTVSLKTNLISSLRLSVSPFAQGVAAKPEIRNPKSEIAWLAGTAADTNAFAEYKKLHREIQECRGGNSPTLVTVSWKPDVTRVLPRGNWLSDDGEIVQPEPPHFLPQPKHEGAASGSRLDLARWLVSRENPLTARVAVNRFWKQFFGAALATPVDDLGLQGEPPSHPELLDWLAVEFMEPSVPPASRRVGARMAANVNAFSPSPARRDAGGTLRWDVKHIVRLIVTSSTYKQSSNLRRELRDLDPNNRWLASQNPRRLDAEFVRDNALKISGLLNEEIGGPSAHPYQPADYYVNLQFPDRDYYASQDDRQYRRGVYAHWQRTFLQPMLANFDAPSREECTALRPVSNTPQQALTLLNDPSFVEAARVFAQKLLAAPAKSDEARLNFAYQRALGRSAKPAELVSLKKFLATQREHLQSDPDEAVKLQKAGLAPTPKHLDAVELAVWTGVCRVVLNLHETISVY